MPGQRTSLELLLFGQRLLLSGLLHALLFELLLELHQRRVQLIQNFGSLCATTTTTTNITRASLI